MPTQNCLATNGIVIWVTISLLSDSSGLWCLCSIGLTACLMGGGSETSGVQTWHDYRPTSRPIL